MTRNLIFILLCLSCTNLSGEVTGIETKPDSLLKNKKAWVITAQALTGSGSLSILYGTWYSKYPQSSFHFINDNSEWMKMDKAGHMMTSYYIGKVGYESLKWAGVKDNKAIWAGGLLGFAYLGTVEIFDGISSEWGFSPGDLAANSMGSALFIAQQLAWKEQRILFKWSFHMTDYAPYNPSQLGKNYQERILKDYNGQTYWLSANIYSIGAMHNRFPKWLNIAVGYGAEGMVGARSNPDRIGDRIIPPFTRRSQFYIAPDIDLTRIPTHSKNLKLVLNLIGFIKFPMPALEFGNGTLKFHYFYF